MMVRFGGSLRLLVIVALASLQFLSNAGYAVCPSDAFEPEDQSSLVKGEPKKKAKSPRKKPRKPTRAQLGTILPGAFASIENLAAGPGSFKEMDEDRKREILKGFPAWYESQKRNSFDGDAADAAHSPSIPAGAHVSHVTERDIVTFQDVKKIKGKSTASDELIERFGDLAYTIAALQSGARPVVSAPATVARTKISHVSQLAILKGFAGLWTRGGGEIVKGIVPFNLRQLLTEEEIRSLLQSSAALQNLPAIDEGLLTAGSVARQKIKAIVEKARSMEHARTPLELTVMQAAILSRLSGSYVSLDFWTGEHTHEAVKQDLESLRSKVKNQTLRVFINKTLNDKLVATMDAYFGMSDLLRQKHIFGYQRSVPPLRYDPNNTHRPLTFDPFGPLSGEGAGTFLRDLRESFRIVSLCKMGVRHIVFQNAEVMSPLGEDYSVFKSAQIPVVGAVVVPIDPTKNYRGGGPYRIEFPNDPQPHYMLLEDSNVSPQLREGRGYFNTNTIFVDVSVPSPTDFAFEPKNGIFRVKVNAGDHTLKSSTVFMGGEIGRHYENLKTFADYIARGSDVVSVTMESFREMLELIH